MKNSIFRTVSIAILVVSFFSIAKAEVRYEVFDLGGFGPGTWSRAMSINNNGQIVGDVVGSGPSKAVSYSENNAPVILIPSTSNFESSQAFAVNDQGIIGGYIEYRATVFDASGQGNNTQVCSDHSFIMAINNQDQAGGLISGQAAVIDLSGAQNNLSLGSISGYIYSLVQGMNNHGQGVGYAMNNDDASPFQNSTPVIYDMSGNGYNLSLVGIDGEHGAAIDINDDGVIVGTSNLPGENQKHHAIIFDNTGNNDYIDLGSTVSGLEYETAIVNAINNSGQIVGSAFNWISGEECAVLFDPTGSEDNIDLNTLVDPSSGWTLTAAWDINDNGWIVGEGVINGQYNAFLLKPVPEPATLTMMLLGLGIYRMKMKK